MCEVCVAYQNELANKIYPDSSHNETDAVSSMPRVVATTAGQTLNNQAMCLTYFTANKTFASSRVVFMNSVAAGATPTLVRAALFSVNPVTGDGLQIAEFANDTALFSVLNTVTTKIWTAPVTVTLGQRYALGVLCVTGAAAPILIGSQLGGGVGAFANRWGAANPPRISGSLNGQSDIPASFLGSGISNLGGRAYISLIA